MRVLLLSFTLLVTTICTPALAVERGAIEPCVTTRDLVNAFAEHAPDMIEARLLSAGEVERLLMHVAKAAHKLGLPAPTFDTVLIVYFKDHATTFLGSGGVLCKYVTATAEEARRYYDNVLHGGVRS